MSDPDPSKWDTSPETPAEQAEAEESPTQQHDPDARSQGGATEDLLAGQILSQLRQLRQIAEADRLDRRTWRDEDLADGRHRGIVLVGILIALTAVFLGEAVVGLALVVALAT